MSHYPTTRKTRNQIGKQENITNENLTRLPLPGKASLKDTTNKVLGLKRKSENDNFGNQLPKKRSAFGDITNAIEKTLRDNKKEIKKEEKKARISKPAVKPNAKQIAPQFVVALPRTTSHLTSHLSAPEVSLRRSERKSNVPNEDSFDESLATLSQEANQIKLEESADYLTASEGSPVTKCKIEKLDLVSKQSNCPEGVDDFDEEMRKDPFAVSCYAQEIFDYYKEREKKFPIDKYISRQPDVSKSMRAILVDWMVEVQESFELNHETLYLAIKLVDLYLSKVIISRDKLQLVGSTAIFIACKFDERIPPYIDDFLYICDDAYKRKELISLEIKMLKTLGFDLGIPLSYRYLRRYARCAKVKMEDLTFARFILETSLMEYDFIDVSDSILGGAALCLALLITGSSKWTPTLQHYSGHSMEDLYHCIQLLHHMLCQPHKDHLKTIRNKYSHRVFFEVAKISIPETLNL